MRGWVMLVATFARALGWGSLWSCGLAAAAIAGLASGCGGSDVECAEADKVTVYADNDKDGYGAPETPKQVCPPTDEDGNPTGEVPRGFSSNDDDCDDLRSEVNPGANEQCDGFDNDCDEESDEGLRTIQFFLDADGDSFGSPDLDLSIASCGAPAGYVDNPDDCDDGNAGINPDAIEVCDNGVDNDCDELADDDDPLLDIATAPIWYFDADGDTYGATALTAQQCLSPGTDYVLNADDCDDADIHVNPSISEVCNHIDDDCDLLIDDSDPDIDPDTQVVWYEDNDADGLGNPDSEKLACFQPWFYVDNTEDCDDDEPLLGHPAPWVRDQDADGFGAGALSANSCTAPGADYVLAALGLDCDDDNPFVNPLGREACDGFDNDCDGLTDDEDDSLDPASADPYYRDADNDGAGDPDIELYACSAPAGYANNDLDCNDNNRFVNPNATETCDGADNDCDLLIDDDDPDVDLGTAGTWYADFDDDGFGDAAVAVDSCGQPQFYVGNDLDCDDNDPDALVFGPWAFDNDGDGVGAGAQSPDSCTAPFADWVPTYYGVDCDNNDPTRFPGNPEICSNGNDEDCSGADLPCRIAAPGVRLGATDGPRAEPVDAGAGLEVGAPQATGGFGAWVRSWFDIGG